MTRTKRNKKLHKILSTPYNRDVDGTDILMIGHNALQTVLATEGYTTAIVLGE